jgi:hypothetical protein
MKLWMTILLQLALAVIELLVKMLGRRLDKKPPPAEAAFREDLMSQVKRLQETTKSFRKKPDNADAPPANLP